MLLQGKIVRNLLIGMTLLNLLLVGVFFYASAKLPWLMGYLFPGKFGPGLSADFTGNFVVLSLLLLVNAIAITLVGFKDTLHAMWAGMRLSPKTMRKFLNEKAGLAADISGVVAAAVQEEEKLELSYIDRAGWVLRVGLILLALSLPALCISLARANAGGAPMFAVEEIAVPNSNVSNEEIWRFTGDQVAASLLLGFPEVYHLRASRLDANTGNLALVTLVWLFRLLIGFGVLLSIIATMRMRALWRYAMEVAMPVRDIIAMEPALAAGREHTEYRHSREEPSWHEPFHEHRLEERVAAVEEERAHDHDHGRAHEHGNGHDHAPDHGHGNGRDHDAPAEHAHASAYEEEVHHREAGHNNHEHDHTGRHHGNHTGERHGHHDDRAAEDEPRHHDDDRAA